VPPFTYAHLLNSLSPPPQNTLSHRHRQPQDLHALRPRLPYAVHLRLAGAQKHVPAVRAPHGRAGRRHAVTGSVVPPRLCTPLHPPARCRRSCGGHTPCLCLCSGAAWTHRQDGVSSGATSAALAHSLYKDVKCVVAVLCTYQEFSGCHVHVASAAAACVGSVQIFCVRAQAHSYRHRALAPPRHWWWGGSGSAVATADSRSPRTAVTLVKGKARRLISTASTAVPRGLNFPGRWSLQKHCSDDMSSRRS
jgi:hypothetical protein